MILEINKKYKLVRDIDKTDKYFIVTYLLDEVAIAQVGWIDKFCDKEYMERNFPETEHCFKKIEVTSIKEFSKSEYYKFKKDNNML